MRTITVMTVIDVVSALGGQSLDGHLYLVDDNRLKGSTDLGTDRLKTRVRVGDKLVWSIFPLEVEAFASISKVVVDPEICIPQRRQFPGTDVVYWEGTILAEPESLPYRIKYMVGDALTEMYPTNTPFLIR